MRKISLFLSLSALCTCAFAAQPLNNRPPLVEKPYVELPLGAVRPHGWLLDQLERMRDGMTGHLDELYPEVMGPRNGWLGGDGDAWERGPYWIDGLLPLAWLLDDAELKAKAQKWVEWALASQQPSGYFGPDTDRPDENGLQRGNTHDWWPKMVVLKILQQHYSATGDRRVIDFMTRYFRYQLATLPEYPLDHWTFWGKQRGGDNLQAVYWLYNITGDAFLLELGELVHRQTLDWAGILTDGHTLGEWFSLHTVNVAQGIKAPVVYYQQSGKKRYVEAVNTGLADIRRFMGWPTGLYGADEWLHGSDPTQGSELCTAVEMMYSLETMLAITGDVRLADLLERVAYNALPTQVTDDFSARQYFQQCNQVEVSATPRNFHTHYHGAGQLFGLLTGYPCCTANLHQGWPKFTASLWVASADGGVAGMAYAPSRVGVEIGGAKVEITEDTGYPFEEQVRLSIGISGKGSLSFPLHLRVPEWCEKATVSVNGRPAGEFAGGGMARVERAWKNGDRVTLDLPMKVSVSRWHENSAAIERGPLVYALRIGERWEQTTDSRYDNPGWKKYWEIFPTTPWNYALPEQNISQRNLAEKFQVTVRPLDGRYPWNLENAPVEISTEGRLLPRWTLYNGSAGPLPYSPQNSSQGGAVERITLIPYGCTTLRIAEFPLIHR